MSVVSVDEAVVFEAHGSRFHSYVAPSRGSRQLCAWRLEVPAGLRGVPHRPTREEVLLVLTGELTATIEDETTTVRAGEVAFVPAGARFGLDNTSAGPASAWVTTSVGLEATLPDGSSISPPWVR